MCDECGVSVDTSAVVSWRGVSDGRQLFWQCRACGGKSSLVLSNQVLRVLSKSFVYPVDEGLMTFWVGELADIDVDDVVRSEEHTSELQSHSFISYAVFCLKKKK